MEEWMNDLILLLTSGGAAVVVGLLGCLIHDDNVKRNTAKIQLILATQIYLERDRLGLGCSLAAVF